MRKLRIRGVARLTQFAIVQGLVTLEETVLNIPRSEVDAEVAKLDQLIGQFEQLVALKYDDLVSDPAQRQTVKISDLSTSLVQFKQMKQLYAGYMTRKSEMPVEALIDRLLLPHFDTDYAARMVLGRHWRDATESQRKRFIEAFYQSLMADYGDAMLQFKREQLKILPFRGDPAANTATVRTEVMREGKVVPVNFSVRRTPEGWKVWDVTIEGISYARNFRNDFGTEVDQQGLEHLIKRLEAQNAGAAPRPSSTPPAPKPAARTG